MCEYTNQSFMCKLIHHLQNDKILPPRISPRLQLPSFTTDYSYVDNYRFLKQT